jgi:hypothetical protein
MRAATAAPMPREAPVTSATLPENRWSLPTTRAQA